jgi:succinate-semialdehyde dehydrogenase/glutarate-semialdehyde dehydrogenase
MLDQAERYIATLDPTPPTEIEVRNPVTGQVIGRVPNSSRAEVQAAVARARQAQAVWAVVPPKERARIIDRFANLLHGPRREHIIKTIRQENGKVYSGAFAETAVIVSTCDYYTKNAPRWLAPERRVPFVRGLYRGHVHRKPIGVVGNISPWNYPLVLSLMDMIPALLAGNSVILKPSEITPYSTIEAAKLLHEAGVPKDVLQVVTGDGSTGAALVDYVDYIMFTGSTATGRRVAMRAAERLIPYSLELGGNDAMVVLRDADIHKAAANAVSAGFENSGQLCMSVERVIVEEPVYEEFLAEMRDWHSQINMGTGDSMDVHIGSMTNQRELERTQAHVEDALAKGGRLLAGGKARPDIGPLFFEPTIIADATSEMLAMQDETFGPLIMVAKAKDVNEALSVANNTPYGLSASLWTGDTVRGEEIALGLQSGDVNINAALLVLGSPDMEFGGVKDSGVGRRNGKQGLLKYTVPQSILVDRLPQVPEAPTIYTRRIVWILRLMRPLKRWLPFLGS